MGTYCLVNEMQGGRWSYISDQDTDDSRKITCIQLVKKKYNMYTVTKNKYVLIYNCSGPFHIIKAILDSKK